MIEPALLSREDIEMATLAVTAYPNERWHAAQVAQLLAHISALEKERDAALQRESEVAFALEKVRAERDAALADNAAREEIVQLWLKSKPEHGDGNAPGHAHGTPKHWDKDGSPCVWCHTDWPRLKAIATTQHPGAALLEEHSKALEAAHSDGRRHALLQMLDRLGMDSACMYGDPEATDSRLSDELWNHVRWLEVRARNEGLERARKRVDELADEAEAARDAAHGEVRNWWRGRTTGFRDAEHEIRSMMEHE